MTPPGNSFSSTRPFVRSAIVAPAFLSSLTNEVPAGTAVAILRVSAACAPAAISRAAATTMSEQRGRRMGEGS